VVHTGRVLEGNLRVGELARAEVDRLRRERTMRHHTVTHLLHRALKDTLGEGTSQQGSLVSPELARFDFNFPRAMSREEIQAVASIINDRTMQDLPVHWEVMPMAQAQKTGAVMMFGEKYGDQVRVVSIGDYSRELCGGTHAHHSGQLGLAVIASESGIGSGKRRIVAYAGDAAHRYVAERAQALEQILERLGARSVDDAGQRVDALLRELDDVRREIERVRSEQSRDVAVHLAGVARPVEGIKVVAQAVDGADDDTMKQLVDRIREQIQSGAVVLGTVRAGQPRFVVGVTRDLAGSRLHAGNLLKEVARAAGGGGGGRPDFATGGGGDPSRVGAALDQVAGVVRTMLMRQGER
jgi:alanyl-tRNA synthetase